MNGTPILAVNRGKYKCVACVDDRATAAKLRTLTTSRMEVERLIRTARPAAEARRDALGKANWRG